MHGLDSIHPKTWSLQTRVALGLLATVLLVLYGSVAWNVLVDCWNDENYSHGVLVPIVVAILLHRRRCDVPMIGEQSARWWVVTAWFLLVGGCSLFVVGSAAAEQFTIRISGVFTLMGITGLLGGPVAMQRYALPLLLLVCMIPLPYTIYYRASFPLQLLSTRLASTSLDWMGLEVVRSGNVFEVNGHALEVVRACSGVRSLMTVMTLMAALIVALRPGVLRGLTLLALAAPVALLGNTVRLITTALLVLRFGPEAAEGWLHDAVGVFSFVLSLLLLAGMVKLLQSREVSATSTEVLRDSASGLVRRPHTRGMRAAHAGRVAPAMWGCLLLLTVTAGYGTYLHEHTPEPDGRTRLADFPLEFSGLEGHEVPMSERILESIGVDDYIFRSYASSVGPEVGLYVGYYRSQRQGSQIHSPQHCYPGAGWDVEQAQPLQVRNRKGRMEELRRMVVERGGRKDVVVYWYDTRTGRISSDIQLKLNLMRTAFFGLPQDAAFVRWSTPIAEDEDVEAATLRLMRVAARALPHLDRTLPFGS